MRGTGNRCFLIRRPMLTLKVNLVTLKVYLLVLKVSRYFLKRLFYFVLVVFTLKVYLVTLKVYLLTLKVYLLALKVDLHAIIKLYIISMRSIYFHNLLPATVAIRGTSLFSIVLKSATKTKFSKVSKCK